MIASPPQVLGGRPSDSDERKPQTHDIVLGEVMKKLVAKVIEQTQSGLILAVIEAAGRDPAQSWQLVIDDAHLECVPEQKH